jgi:hypothetical protein
LTRRVGRTLLYVTYSKLCNKFTVAHDTFTASLSASLLYCPAENSRRHTVRHFGRQAHPDTDPDEI